MECNRSLSEKLTQLRREKGWSQEELAAQLGVSRQSVSKWESAASVPELDKIVRLSELFGVSTDYLLKQEAGSSDHANTKEAEKAGGAADTEQLYTGNRTAADEARNNAKNQAERAETDDPPVRCLSLSYVTAYLEAARSSAKGIAAGVAFCIISPVILLVLIGLAEEQQIGITENMAGGIGTAILLLIIAGAVTLFITNGMKLSPYDVLEREPVDLEPDAQRVMRMEKEQLEPRFKKDIAIGVAFCIISVVPLFIAASFDVKDSVYIYCTALLLTIVAAGVCLIVWAGIPYGALQKVLEEGDYTRARKLEQRKNDNLEKVYWCSVTAIYLAVSFLTNRWDITWIIWPVAGVLFVAVCGLAAMLRKNQ